MSKDLWVRDYDQKYDELIETGVSHEEADFQAVKFANDCMERFTDYLEMKLEDKKLDL